MMKYYSRRGIAQIYAPRTEVQHPTDPFLPQDPIGGQR